MRQNIALQKSIVPTLSRGLKDVFPTGSSEEKAEIRTLQGKQIIIFVDVEIHFVCVADDLFQILNQQRIERISVRSQANFVPNLLPGAQHLVQVTRKMGKWNQFGHMRDGVLYLHAHEALHLIEMVFYNIISVKCKLKRLFVQCRIVWNSTSIQYLYRWSRHLSLCSVRICYLRKNILYILN